jgi:UDP-N-acetylglucosamine 1-carboxyvinyltransferase
VVNGQNKLTGNVHISGAKNAAVAIIPAAIVSRDICVIENLPIIDDVVILAEAVKKIGVKCEFRDPHTLVMDSRNINSNCAAYDFIKKIRASYYLLGALVAIFKSAEVALPGGCDFGIRPIDQHIKGLQMLGAKITIEHGMIKATADKLIGTNIFFDVVSVGATINIMLAATFAEGVTSIENAAKEPHVVDTANFLNMLGANIKGAGTDIIRIFGVKSLHGAEYSIIPDQIEAGTYMIAAAATNGDVIVNNIIPKHMDSLSAKLREMNCEVIDGDDYIQVRCKKKLKSINIKTMTYPGFPTDLQPQIAALLSVVDGTSIITETVWENRFQYVAELKRLGANISVDHRTAVINGVKNLTGAQVRALDLRAGAALLIAALTCNGRTEISDIKYIDRGYENIEKKLNAIGADIKRI